MSNSTIADLFPAGGYRFQAGIKRGDPAPFFRAQDATGKILSERRRWLVHDPDLFAALQPEGAPLLAEFAARCAAWGASEARELHGLGAALEPDFLLLSRGDDGEFRLRGGVVCFPSGWALQEKLGRGMEFIHGPVPGLNATLGPAIQRILSALKSDTGAFRSNWGLAATDELNLHPERGIAGPALPVTLDRLWLRVEEQVLIALPDSGGIAFGIRIALHRLDELSANAAAAQGLARALETMHDDVAAYKRLAEIRGPLVAVLRRFS